MEGRRFRRPLESAALGALFLTKLGIVLWALDRGFGIGEEGVFLLNLNRPWDATPGYEYHRLLTLLGRPPALGVVAARAIRVVMELAAVAVLVSGVLRWYRARFDREGAEAVLPVVLLCLAGTFLSAASRSLSYNDLTNLCVFAAAGGLFHLAADPRRGGPLVPAGLAMGMGFLSGLQLFVKFPAAILLVLSVPPLLWVALRSEPAATRLRLLAAFGAGVPLGVAPIVLASGGPANVVDNYREAFLLGSYLGYDPLRILRNYLVYDLLSHAHLVLSIGVFGACLGAFRLLRRLRPERPSTAPDATLAASLAAALAVLVLATARLHPEFVHPSLLALYGVLLLSLLALVLAASRAGGTASLRDLGLGLVLVALPFVCIVGTDVALTLKLPSHGAPLSVAIAVLASRVRSLGYRLLPATVVLAVSATSAGVFLHTQVFQPYGLATPIYEQRHPVEELQGVKVDRESARFLEELSATLTKAGYRTGDPVVALDYMPGLVHYLGATSPGSAYYMYDNPAFNCFLLNRTELERPPFVLLGKPMSEAQRGCLEAFDLDAGFELVGVLRNPYGSVYTYFFNARALPDLFVHAPRR